jgi:hypothetical protein
MGTLITDYLVYRWRYFLGYALIGLAVTGLLFVAAFYVPGGLSQAEMTSVIQSDRLSAAQFVPEMVIHMPYHAVQKASLILFGDTMFGIKAPSVLFGILSAMGVFLLLRFWFRKNIAVLTTVLVITTGQFFFVAQSGNPGIMYIFWSVWILLAATMISRHKRFHIFWKVVLFAAAALSLYTPLSLYILLALTSATVLHPHLRYLIRRLSRVKLALACFFALILVTPLIYAIVKQPDIGLQLLGIPTGHISWGANILSLVKQYVDFLQPTSGTLMNPVYGLGSIALVVFGILRLFSTKYTARSYITTAWLVLLLPVVIINPLFTSVTFVPILLLMGAGLEGLLRSWYHLFPKNPYARIAGLIPLVILIGGMVASGVNRYLYGYHYDPNAAVMFSQDLRLINSQLRHLGKTPVTLVVSGKEQTFYSILAKHHKNVSLTTAAPATITQTTILTHDASGLLPKSNATTIVTDRLSLDADRLYIYKPNAS